MVLILFNNNHYIRLNFKRQEEGPFQFFLDEREAGTACEKGLLSMRHQVGFSKEVG